MPSTSLLLVVLQILLMAAIALPFGIGSGWSDTAGVLVVGGVFIGCWALEANRPGNFNILPEPRSGGRLVTHGPYRFIRHPMYTAVVVAMAGFCTGYATPWRWAALAALVAVLALKADVEERAMANAHPGYADYARRRKRFVPFVW
jgi:protein-S-isoprenylcysteine O-methyltransferase Ste14